MILDTFAFLFQTEGTEKVSKEIKELSKTTNTVNDSNSTLKQGFEGLIGIIAPLTAAYAGLRAMMDFTNENDQLFQMSEISGISARAISELGFAFSEFGGNAQTAAHTLQGLERQIMQLQRTGSGALVQAGMMYGLNISTDPQKMLENIAKRMETLTRSQRVDLGRMLGLDNATILTLSKGVKGFREEMERAKKYTFIDEKAVEQSHQLKRNMAECGAVLGSIGVDIATIILPYANDIITFVKDALEYMKKHKFLFLEIAAIVGTIAAYTINWKNIGMALLSPIGRIVAALTIVALIGEDIYGYFNGMPSLLGDLVAKCPRLKEALDAIGDAVKKTWKYVESGQMYEDLKSEFDRLQTWWETTTLAEEAEKQFKNIADWWNTTTLFDDISNGFQDIIDEDIKPLFDDLLNEWENFSLEEKTAKIYMELSESFESLQNKWNQYTDEVSKILNDFVVKNKLLLQSFSQYMATDFWNDVGRGFGHIKNTMVDIGQVISEFTKTAINSFVELASITKDILIEAFDKLCKIVKDSLVSAFNALVDAFNNLKSIDFIQSIKNLITTINDFFAGIWNTMKDIGNRVASGYQETQRPVEETIAAANNFYISERENAQARAALYQSTSVNNTTRNSQLNAPVNIYVQQGNQQTGQEIAEGLIDGLGSYANGST